MEITAQIFEILVVPILGLLVKYLIDFLEAHREAILVKTDSEIAKKYTDMVCTTIKDCVIATNQTYVDSLKAQGKFDEAAQGEAFSKTINAVLDILSEDAKEYLREATGDINTYLEQLIEAEVNGQKSR